MADLNPLIRVRKHAVEQKQKFLAGLYREAETLAAKKKAFQDEMERERLALDHLESVEAVTQYGRYAEGVRGKIRDIDEAAGKLEVRITIAQEDMRDAFAELKNIEIPQARRDEEAADEIAKKESDELDAIGIEGFRRSKNED
jgi:flagellar FliJ protein